MAIPPSDVDYVFNQPNQAPDDDVDFLFQTVNTVAAGGGGRGLAAITRDRAKRMHRVRDRDWKMIAFWRLEVLNNPLVFAEYYKDRFNDLSLAAFNQKQTEAVKDPMAALPPALTRADLESIRAQIKDILDNRALVTETEKVNAFYKLMQYNAKNKQIYEFIRVSLAKQYGREIRGESAYHHRRTDSAFEEGRIADPVFQNKDNVNDVYGGFSMIEALDTLDAALMCEGLSVKQNDPHHFEIVVDRPGQDPLTLVDCKISEITTPDSKLKTYVSNYKIGDKVGKDDMGQAIAALADAIASHRQVCDVDSANVAKLKGKHPLQVMYLAQELIATHHMHLDLTAVRAQIDAAVLDPTSTYTEEQKGRWELIKYLSNVYHVRDNSEFFAVPDQAVIDALNGAYPSLALPPVPTIQRDANGRPLNNDSNRYLMNEWIKQAVAKDVYAPTPANRHTLY